MTFTKLILPIAGWQRGGGVMAAAETWLWERRPGWGKAGEGGVALCGRPRLDPRHELLVKVALHGCSLLQRGGEARWEAVHHRQGALRVVHLGRGLEFSTFLSCWSFPKVSFSSTNSADPEPVMSPHLNSNTARFLKTRVLFSFLFICHIEDHILRFLLTLLLTKTYKAVFHTNASKTSFYLLLS